MGDDKILRARLLLSDYRNGVVSDYIHLKLSMSFATYLMNSMRMKIQRKLVNLFFSHRR